MSVTREDTEADERARAAVASLFADDRVSQGMGIELVSIAAGRLRISMLVRPEMTNGWGICHGGVIFTLADSAFAFACRSYGDPMVGANSQIEFIAPTSVGDRLEAIATEVWRTDRSGIYDVAVINSTGNTVAHFRGRCARWRGTPASLSTEGIS